MNTVRAVPLEYSGVTFRSNLEADWAATFDLLGMTWSYEPEAVQIGGIRYLPDFYLEPQNVWCEVKGPHDERISKVYAFAEALDGDPHDVKTPLVVVLRCSVNGLANWHGATLSADLNIRCCTRCENYSWIDRAGAWQCRVCHFREKEGTFELGAAAGRSHWITDRLPFGHAPRPQRSA